MSSNPFENLERICSQCSMMDKATKVAFLRGQLHQLNDMAYKMTLYLRNKGYTTDAEKQQAMWLIDAINSVQEEEKKASRELTNEGLMEIMKMFLR